MPTLDGSKLWGVAFMLIQLLIGIAGLLIVRTMDRVESTLEKIAEKQYQQESRISRMEGQQDRPRLNHEKFLDNLPITLKLRFP